MLQRIVGWVVPSTPKDCSAFIFRVKGQEVQELGLLDPEDEETMTLQNIRNYLTQRHIPEDKTSNT
jgi:hypothetical protein